MKKAEKIAVITALDCQQKFIKQLQKEFVHLQINRKFKYDTVMTMLANLSAGFKKESDKVLNS